MGGRMRESNITYASMTTLAVLFGAPTSANAQRAFFGAGVGVASVPRSLTPLCGAARRLNGASLSAQAGFYAKRLRVSAVLEGTARGYADAAECVPRAGISVDSMYAPGSSAAVTAGAEMWYPATSHLGLSVGTGWVLDHRAWYLSGGVGWQYRKLRVEMVARRHRISFDEVRRDFGSGTTREISRSSQTEAAWGGLIRVVLVTR